MIKELRTKSDIELGELISKLKIQLLEMRFKLAAGEVDGISKIKQIRKTIAIVMTVLKERKIDISFTSNSVQLIHRNEENKQEIKAIKLEKIISDSKNSELKITDKQSSKNEQNTKPSNQNNNVINNSSNTNIKQHSENKQPMQIRRSSKG